MADSLGGQRHCKDFLPFFCMEAAAAKDWSDQINTFFEYFFLIHFTIALKKSLRYRKCSPIIPPIKFLEHLIKHPNISFKAHSLKIIRQVN